MTPRADRRRRNPKRPVQGNGPKRPAASVRPNGLSRLHASVPTKRRGLIVWCLILFGLGEFLNSLWEVAFGRHIPRSASPTLARALTESPGWLWVPETLVGGTLGLLMAWQFFNMSTRVFGVLYATLLWYIVVMAANLLANPAGRAVIASFGLLPLLLAIGINVALLVYAHHLHQAGRLGP